jgi:hypothetical protein
MSMEPMRFAAPIEQTVEAVNTIAQSHESDPVYLLAMALAVVITDDPVQRHHAIVTLDRFGFDLRDRRPSLVDRGGLKEVVS